MLKTIRILTSVASYEWYFDPGVVVSVGEKFVSNKEVPLEVALEWIKGGVRAEVVDAGPESVERTATLPPAPETAVTRRGSKPKGTR